MYIKKEERKREYLLDPTKLLYQNKKEKTPLSIYLSSKCCKIESYISMSYFLFAGGKNLCSQLQNIMSKFNDKFQICVSLN